MKLAIEYPCLSLLQLHEICLFFGYIFSYMYDLVIYWLNIIWLYTHLWSNNTKYYIFIIFGRRLLPSKCWKGEISIFFYLVFKGKNRQQVYSMFLRNKLEDVFLRLMHFMITEVCVTGFWDCTLPSAKTGKGFFPPFCIVVSPKTFFFFFFFEYSDGSSIKGAGVANGSHTAED